MSKSTGSRYTEEFKAEAVQHRPDPRLETLDLLDRLINDTDGLVPKEGGPVGFTSFSVPQSGRLLRHSMLGVIQRDSSASCSLTVPTASPCTCK